MTGSLALVATLVVAVMGVPAEAAQSSCTWQTRVLQAPAGATRHQVEATDHAGGYSGTGSFASGVRVLYWKNGQVIDYGVSGRGTDRVVGQNRGGTIAGISSSGLGGVVASSFRIRGGQWEFLPALPGSAQASRAVGIADNGDVYGTNRIPQGTGTVSVVVRWPQDRPGVVERVPGVPDGMRVVDVDHDGTLLVGPDSVYPWPHVWRAGQLTRLPEPPNTQHGYGVSIADGLVAGSLRVGSSANRPAYWDRNGQPHVLSERAEAVQINRNGLLVAAQSATTPQVWRLGALEGQLGDVAAVNTIGDDDSVGGAAQTSSGNPAAAVWRCV